MTTSSPRLDQPRLTPLLLSTLLAGLASHALSAASLTGLGGLPGAPVYSEAAGVSDDGSVVVGKCASRDTEAFRWSRTGGMVVAADLLNDGLHSWALGVSRDGSTVVGARFLHTEDSGYNEAFVWPTGGGVLGLGDFPGGFIPPGISFYSEAGGVSSDGSVVVGQGLSDDGQEPFRWTAGGSLGRLGNPGGGVTFGVATGVSADGSVVVGQGYLSSGPQAFRWTSAGGVVGLGDLLGGWFESMARSVSPDGSVVAGYGTSTDGEEAFVWTAGGGIQSLFSVLLAAGVELTGWTSLTRATAVSADGRHVVGTGKRNGNTEAFLVDLGAANGPTLNLGQTDGQWRLVWTAGGLEVAPTPAGPWSPVPDAVSPRPLNPGGNGEFFRVRGE